VKVIFRHELAGQTKVSCELLGRQNEAFIFRRRVDVTRFYLHEAKTAGPITPATRTNQEAGILENFPH
jgi:hypothetical protein